MEKIVLNGEQQAALEKIKAGGNYFVFGAAGTGKSTLLAHIGKEIPDAVFAAPTGSAAQKNRRSNHQQPLSNPSGSIYHKRNFGGDLEQDGAKDDLGNQNAGHR